MAISNWENSELVTPKTRGFIYLIINKKSNKLYVGKKKTVSETSKKVMGKTTGRLKTVRETKESNWRVYNSSCKPLLEDIKTLGLENFRKIILGAYDELNTVNYGEAELQFLVKVLDEENKYEWYNNNIYIKAMKPPKDREYIRRITEILKEL